MWFKRILPFLMIFLLLFSLLPITNSTDAPVAVSGPFARYDTGYTPGVTNRPWEMSRIPGSNILFVTTSDDIGTGDGVEVFTYRLTNTTGLYTSGYIDKDADLTGNSYYFGSSTFVYQKSLAAGAIFAIYRPDDTGRITTFRAFGSNGTIEEGKLDGQTTTDYASGMRNVTVVGPYENSVIIAIIEGANKLSTWAINKTTGVIGGSALSTATISSSTGCTYPWLTMADSDTIIVSYRNASGLGFTIQTFNISSAGVISGTGMGANLYDSDAVYNDDTSHVLCHVAGNVYLVWGRSSDNDALKYATYRIYDNGTIYKGTIDTEDPGITAPYSTLGLYPMGLNQFVSTWFGNGGDKDVSAQFFNVTDAGVIETAFKTWDSGRGDTNAILRAPVSYVGNYCWSLLGWDDSENPYFYQFWRNQTTVTSWKTASTWNGTLMNDTLWQKHDWNGTLKNTTLWQKRADWNGTLWNNSRIWRITTLKERFILTPNNAPTVTDTSWRGQSFTIGNTGANTNFYLHSIALSLRKDAVTDPALIYTVRVYAADSNHKPTGPILGTATINTGRLTVSFSWINCSGCVGPSPLLTAGTKYVIVLFKNTPSSYNIRWGTRNNATAAGSASYTGGYSITSSNSGLTWSLATGIDCDFMVWGSTLSDFPPIWNGTLYNSTIAWKLGADWNGTLWNSASWLISGNWNGTLWNFSHGFPTLIKEWNGTLYNDTLWQAHIWNGTLYNLTLYQQIGLWNGSIWNSTHWMPVVGNWNGTLTSIVHLTLHIHGNGWISRSPVFIPYSYGDTVNCTATAGMLYNFHDIMGLTGTNVYVVTLDRDRIVYANFTTNSSSGLNFTYTDDTDLPKITDVVNANNTETTDLYGWARIFTYGWVWTLGGWFFALVLGAIGGAIYLQYKRVEVVAAYFIIVLLLFAAVTQSIAYVGGILVALILGALIWKVLRTKW